MERWTSLDLGLADYLRDTLPNCRASESILFRLLPIPIEKKAGLFTANFLEEIVPLVLVEDMALGLVNAATLTSVIVAPLRIEGGDGAPVTVFGLCK